MKDDCFSYERRKIDSYKKQRFRRHKTLREKKKKRHEVSLTKRICDQDILLEVYIANKIIQKLGLNNERNKCTEDDRLSMQQ